ncbi:hypothetical protein CREGCYN_06820 [Synechococcus sp. M16CYN]
MNEIKVISIDDEKIFGDVFHEPKFSQVIEANLLSDYQVLLISIDDYSIREKVVSKNCLPSMMSRIAM